MKFILIYAIFKDNEEADKIIFGLLNEKLIACANLFPVSSVYHWKGAVEKGSETVCIIKTRTENWDKVKEYIEKNHSYEIPCIIKLSEVEANDSFASWVQREVR